jgi:hypothetical protein
LASRCYRLRHLNYSALASLGIGVGDDLVQRLAPAKLHPLTASIDYFFQTAPEKLESPSLTAEKDELNAEPCGDQPRDAPAPTQTTPPTR